MGLWNEVKKVGKKIKKGAKKVGKKAKQAADKIQEGMSAAGNAVGNAIEDAGNAVGGGGWIGSVMSNVAGLISTGIRAAFDLAGGVIGGAIKIGVGLLTLNVPLVVEGFANVIATAVGVVFLVALGIVSLVQSIISIEKDWRHLDSGERSLLARIFHDSLDYDVIRLVLTGGGIYGWFGDRPYVRGNTIYMRRRYRRGNRMDLDDERLLVHEVTHVWQYQNRGSRYIAEAAYAQVFVKDRYNWELEIRGSRQRTNWEQFNREAQAEFFEDLHDFGRQLDRRIDPPGGNVADGYNFAGAFFVEAKDPVLKPIFPFSRQEIDPPYPATGAEAQFIEKVTAIAVRATETVREG
ncbi:MAG: hypothetical protein MJA83_05000 [Gammaproteobacteria bacterium]|nr:hypothetical protein [Gammaproteobacteria bacterium]